MIVDSRLRTPETAKVMPRRGARERVWIATTADQETRDASAASLGGALVLTNLGTRDGPGNGDRVELEKLMDILSANGITRLLVEGGPAVWQAFAAAGLTDEAIVFRSVNSAAKASERAFMQLLRRWLPGAALSLAERRRIGDDEMLVFRRS